MARPDEARVQLGLADVAPDEAVEAKPTRPAKGGPVSVVRPGGEPFRCRRYVEVADDGGLALVLDFTHRAEPAKH